MSSSTPVRLAPPALWALILPAIVWLLSACSALPEALRGTGDLGVVIERADGRVKIIDTSAHAVLATVDGLGDLSHASVVFSRDARYAFVFGRDGGLTKVDLLQAKIVARVIQAGNAIGGSISHDGRIVVAQNYAPGGVKAFDANTLELLAEVPAITADGTRSKVVGLADLSGKRFIYSLFEAGEIWITDFSDPRNPQTERFAGGKQPYDALVTPDGRHYIAGLSVRMVWRRWICGTWTRAAARYSPVMARARHRCRCTRCRTCAAGRSPRVMPICRRSGAMKCWWSTPMTGRRSAASRSGVSPCS